MLHEHAAFHRVRQGADGHDDGEPRRHHHRELDRRLTALVARKPQKGPFEMLVGRTPLAEAEPLYKLLMPSDMAVHNSSSFGLNTVIARMAITTKTQTSER